MSDVEDNVEVIDNRQHFFCVWSTDCSVKNKERDDGNRLLETDFIAVASRLVGFGFKRLGLTPVIPFLIPR